MIGHGSVPASTRRIRLSVGDFVFSGRLEAQAAPKSVAVLAELLPLERSALHARWSGEAGWAPLSTGFTLAPENATAYPHPGQLLLYAGMRSEPELLVPYGCCAFASRAGALAGNHVITLEGDLTNLRDLGETLLWKGAQPLRLEWQ
jgi:hypothetical protein